MISKHVLITGANGFVGRHLNIALQTQGFSVSCIVRGDPTPFCGHGFYSLDLEDGDKVNELVTSLQPDYVVHLAGGKNRAGESSSYSSLYSSSIIASLNVIEACRMLPNFRRFVFFGSCDEYGDISAPFKESHRESPVNVYGASKLAITHFLGSLHKSCNFPFVAIRPSVIYGPGQRDGMFLPALIRSLVRGKRFSMTAGEQYRDFVYISDVINSVLKALTSDNQINGAVVNIGAGVSYQVKQVAAEAACLVHPDASRLLEFGKVPYRPSESMQYAVDVTLARKVLAWEPVTSLQAGLSQTVEYYKSCLAGHGVEGA